MPKLVIITNLASEHVQRVREAAPGWEVIVGGNPSDWQPHLREAVVVGGWNQQVLDECIDNPHSAIQWIHNWGAGVDHVPFAKLAARDIILTNSSGVHAFPISETILAMMLALTRKLHTYVWNQTRKEWYHAKLSLEMHGKTVGILGVGAIGLETARLCKAFGMRVLGLRRSGQGHPTVDHMVDMTGLHTLLQESDYVVNTLPLTDETRGLMNANAFQHLKPSAFYINIGRGGTTDEQALMTALQENRLAGAGLDVFATEPLPADSPLWEMEQVLITPHTAGSTSAYNSRVLDIFIPNLKTFVEGKTPNHNRIDLALQY